MLQVFIFLINRLIQFFFSVLIRSIQRIPASQYCMSISAVAKCLFGGRVMSPVHRYVHLVLILFN